MKLPARAAAVRGDNYQYAIAWLHAADALTDPAVASISVEDAGGGQFDDIVVRRTDHNPDHFEQAKSSNSGNVVVDEEWLTTPATTQGRSPLQHFHATWRALREGDRLFALALTTNRGFDNVHPLLGPLRDNFTARIRVDELCDKGPRSNAKRALRAWVEHLESDEAEILQFLEVVRWEQAGSEGSIRDNAKRAMRLAGLRDDDEAVEIGIAIVREWVMTGAGPQTPDELRIAVDKHNLLDDSAQLTLLVNGIDRPANAEPAHVTIDWVDRFPDAPPERRYEASNPQDWTGQFPEDLHRAQTSLEQYRARHVLVTGAMRQAMHFATGRTLPDVRRWVLAVNQRGEIWTSDAKPQRNVHARVLERRAIDQGSDIAVAVCLANDVTEAVSGFLTDRGVPVGTLLALGPDDAPGGTAVPSNSWLTAWVRSARDAVRDEARAASRIHLFMSGPASAALLLGHQWNALAPDTVVYEYDQRTYFPTFELP
jgi:SMODS-associated and fused to various effectors sensor domain